MTKKRILFIFGTRPEAIKMAPLIKECERRSNLIEYKVCITGQHKQMLQQVLDFFEIVPDYDLSLMKSNQTLFDITSNVLVEMDRILSLYEPDWILVQGDTTTAMAGALAGYYKKIRVGHIEAGLRSGDIYSPFPEEVNRKIIGTMANYHFAPTPLAIENLKQENITANVFLTGNTVIDALLWGVERVRKSIDISSDFSYLKGENRKILITAHRRESFGVPFEHICSAILYLAKSNPSIDFIYPVHLNPNVQDVVYKNLSYQSNIHLIPPLDYPHLLWILDKSYLVMTDSGGIQEEAPSLGKPVLVLREVTERQEGISAGTAILVGTVQKNIIDTCQKLIDDKDEYTKMANAVNPYGDGRSAHKIIDLLLKSA
jgi:UDP-N-acetylglucosamine 2-epimerase (non-hydrolysing)